MHSLYKSEQWFDFTWEHTRLAHVSQGVHEFLKSPYNFVSPHYEHAVRDSVNQSFFLTTRTNTQEKQKNWRMHAGETIVDDGRTENQAKNRCQ